MDEKTQIMTLTDLKPEIVSIVFTLSQVNYRKSNKLRIFEKNEYNRLLIVPHTASKRLSFNK